MPPVFPIDWLLADCRGGAGGFACQVFRLRRFWQAKPPAPPSPSKMDTPACRIHGSGRPSVVALAIVLLSGCARQPAVEAKQDSGPIAIKTTGVSLKQL